MELMEDSIIILRIGLYASILFNLCLDILCYKYRSLAAFYLYSHCVHLILIRMMPNAEGQYISVQPI